MLVTQCNVVELPRQWTVSLTDRPLSGAQYSEDSSTGHHDYHDNAPAGHHRHHVLHHDLHHDIHHDLYDNCDSETRSWAGAVAVVEISQMEIWLRVGPVGRRNHSIRPIEQKSFIQSNSSQSVKASHWTPRLLYIIVSIHITSSHSSIQYDKMLIKVKPKTVKWKLKKEELPVKGKVLAALCENLGTQCVAERESEWSSGGDWVPLSHPPAPTSPLSPPPPTHPPRPKWLSPSLPILTHSLSGTLTVPERHKRGPLPYLIFVIFFTLAYFRAWKFYTQKCVNSQQNLPRDKTA